MKDTSFGQLDVLLTQDRKPVIEHLIFSRGGRPHQHAAFESFFVLEGEGFVIRDEEKIPVQPGSLVTIPPKTRHFMEPSGEYPLKGFLWYHEAPLAITHSS